MISAEARTGRLRHKEEGIEVPESSTERLVQSLVLDGYMDPSELLVLKAAAGKTRWQEPDFSD